MDISIRKVFSGTDATPGFISAWNSKNDYVGKGEQAILKIREGQQIEYEIRLFKLSKFYNICLK